MNRIHKNVAIIFLFLVGGCQDAHSPEAISEGRTSATLSLVCRALGMNYVENKYFPEDGVEMRKILFNEAVGYLRSGASVDGWGNEFLYKKDNASSAIVWSMGPDSNVDFDNISCSISADEKRSIIMQEEVDGISGRKSRKERSFSDYMP